MSGEYQVLNVRLLGGPILEWKGEPFAFSASYANVVLFAMLLVAGPGKRLLRSDLGVAFWPAEHERERSAFLSESLTHLQAALPRDVAFVCADDEAVWLGVDAAVTCDIDAFERDPNPYAPEFLAGYSHRWAAAERRRLGRLCVASLLKQADELSAAGDEVGAIGCARFAMEIDEAEVARIGRRSTP